MVIIIVKAKNSIDINKMKMIANSQLDITKLDNLNIRGFVKSVEDIAIFIELHLFQRAKMRAIPQRPTM